MRRILVAVVLAALGLALLADVAEAGLFNRGGCGGGRARLFSGKLFRGGLFHRGGGCGGGGCQ